MRSAAPAPEPSLSPPSNHCLGRSPPTAQHLFTCTFCWHLSAGPPVVLGRTARLAYGPCARAVLALAVCWVCGSVVVRGDECVSLGWCFWHRACYGCLLCGSRLVCSGAKAGELFEEREGNGAGEEHGEGEMVEIGAGAREIDQVPLCANCLVDAEIDELDAATVVQKGLRRIDKYDGGLSHRRWEAMRGRPSEKKRTGSEHETSSRHARSRTAYPPLLDGTEHDAELAASTGSCQVPLDSTIYVSILDPIGQPAFKPSPTKPIPKWMQMLPSYRATHEEGAPASVLDDFFGRPDLSSPGSTASTVCPPKTQTFSSDQHSSVIRDTEDVDSMPKSPTPCRTPSPSLMVNEADTEALQIGRKQALSFVSTEPMKRPSSRLGRRVNAGTSASSSYLTPPEYLPPPNTSGQTVERPTLLLPSDVSDSSHVSSRHFLAPLVPVRKSSSSTVGSSSKKVPGQEQKGARFPSAADCLPRRHSPRLRPSPADSQEHQQRTMPVMSSEYLEKYSPVRAPSLPVTRPIASETAGVDPHSAHGLHPAGKLRSSSMAEPSSSTAVGESSVDDKSPAAAASNTASPPPKKQDPGGQPSKRLNLQAELRRLFGVR